MAKRRRHNSKGRTEGEARFIQIPYWVLETPAALALSGSAVKVLVYLLKRFNGANNGRIAFGSRSGCFVRNPVDHKNLIDLGLGMKPRTISDALYELVAAGFIRCTKPSTFDQKRLTREWRLTWLAVGAELPTRDFQAVIGTTFKRQKKQTPGRPAALLPELKGGSAPYVADGIQAKKPHRAASRPIADRHRAATRPHLVTIPSASEEPHAARALKAQRASVAASEPADEPPSLPSNSGPGGAAVVDRLDGTVTLSM